MAFYSEKAAVRQSEGQKSGGRGKKKENFSADLPECFLGKATEEAAKDYGVSSRSIQKAIARDDL
jgi:hypothetical protein